VIGNHSTAATFLLALALSSVGGAVCAVENPDPDPEIGIVEKLGDYVPGDIGFVDSYGDSVYLGDLVDKPTIITLVYYHCPTICKPLLSGVVEVIDKTGLDAGVDYTVLTISFDDTDTPASAADIRTNFTNSLKKKLRPGAWKFLTADSLAIARFTQSVGFGFQRQENDFAHGTSLIVLAPDGKIVRYLYGLRYMPFDLKMAVSEANRGNAAPSIARVLRYCFSYDPEGRRYVFNVTRVAGASIILFAVGFVVFVSTTGRLRKRKRA